MIFGLSLRSVFFFFFFFQETKFLGDGIFSLNLPSSSSSFSIVDLFQSPLSSIISVSNNGVFRFFESKIFQRSLPTLFLACFFNTLFFSFLCFFSRRLLPVQTMSLRSMQNFLKYVARLFCHLSSPSFSTLDSFFFFLSFVSHPCFWQCSVIFSRKQNFSKIRRSFFLNFSPFSSSFSTLVRNREETKEKKIES